MILGSYMQLNQYRLDLRNSEGIVRAMYFLIQGFIWGENVPVSQLSVLSYTACLTWLNIWKTKGFHPADSPRQLLKSFVGQIATLKICASASSNYYCYCATTPRINQSKPTSIFSRLQEIWRDYSLEDLSTFFLYSSSIPTILPPEL